MLSLPPALGPDLRNALGSKSAVARRGGGASRGLRQEASRGARTPSHATCRKNVGIPASAKSENKRSDSLPRLLQAWMETNNAFARARCLRGPCCRGADSESTC